MPLPQQPRGPKLPPRCLSPQPRGPKLPPRCITRASHYLHNNTVHNKAHTTIFKIEYRANINFRPLYRVTLTFRSYGALIESERGLSLCTVLKIRHLFNNLV